MEENEKKIITVNEVNQLASDFLRKFPLTICWRIKQHSKIMAKHLNPDEEIFYLFPAQKNPSSFTIYETCLTAFTNKRILVARKNVFWGYQIFSVTPDLFNDFEVYKGLIFGKLEIDTAKEVIRLSNIDPRALVEIETNLSEYLLRIKPKFIKKQEGIKEKLLFQLNPNKKEIKNNNSAMNIKKDSFIDKKFNNSERIVRTTDFLNYDNSNINKNTKIFNFKEKKNQIYIKKINTKNNNYINFHKKYSKNKLINPIINDSEMTSPKELEDLKIKEKIESPNIDEKPLNNIIEESKDNKND